MKLKSTWLLLTLALLVAVVGCSQNPSDTATVTNDQLAIDFGGYDATAEAPAFGDAELLAMSAGEGEYNDPLLGTPSSDSVIADPDAGLFHFRAVWGQLEYDSTFTTPTDWAGSITISRGAAIVRRLIRFEPATDSLLPRTDRTLIEYASTTTVHNDGISVDFYVPPPGDPVFDSSWAMDTDSLGNVIDSTLEVDTVYAEPATLTFVAGSYSRTFTLDELAMLDEIVELDDGNAIAFQAQRIYRFACPRGFIRGKWGFDEEDQGRFRGEWMSDYGVLAGWVQGTFDRTDEGKVFYGKWITKNGLFEGLLRGRWGFHPNNNASDRAFEVAGGWFKGDIYSAEEEKIGQLKGKWKSADHPVKDHYFQARWKLDCSQYVNDGMDDDEVDHDDGDHDRDRERDNDGENDNDYGNYDDNDSNYDDNGGNTEG